MIVVVHRAECSVYLRDECLACWFRYRFIRSRLALTEREGGWTKIRAASVPLEAHAPVGSKVVGEGRRARLVTYFGPLDAASVAHLAGRGERGFRWAARPGESIA